MAQVRDPIAGWPTWMAVDALQDAIGAFQDVQDDFADLGAGGAEPDAAFEVALKHAWRGEIVDVYWDLYDPDTVGAAGAPHADRHEAERAQSRYERAVEALDEAAAVAIAILQRHPDKAALREVLRSVLSRVDLDDDAPDGEGGHA